MDSLIVLYSYHHRNTEKVAKAMAEVVSAEIRWPQRMDPEDLESYNLVGFGSGIYNDKHHKLLLDLAERTPEVVHGRAFLFATCGVPGFAFERGALDDYLVEIHVPLRKRLESKGYEVVGEFTCPGWNTNKFLKLFGGLNRGRPNANDLERARAFARRVQN